MIFIIVYLLLCLAVASAYNESTWGYTGGVIICILLTPVVGLIISFFAPQKPDETIQQQILVTQQQLLQQQMSHSKPQLTLTDELLKLEELKSKNLINDQEYAKMREKIMKDVM